MSGTAGAADEVTELACHARVSWFDIRQLSATAAKTIASTIIGSMSGRRELMAALEPHAQDHYDMAGEDAVWIDYIADCGDGWDASHSIAWLVGRDALLLNRDLSPTPQPHSADCRVEAELPETSGAMILPAGRALILGGDEVYPTASRDGYDERLVGPMQSARLRQPGGREIFAIPGNHDWYDGLTSFVRLFCQSPASRRWLGAWQTRQRRSYFAIALPHRWWLWGVDLALEDDFDPPQYDYFVAQARKLQRGDQLILAVPTPVWLALERGDDDGALRLGKLELVMRVALDRGATIPLIVTGDSHFYAHHRAAGRDYVVCGGGGAFTIGTVQVPIEFSTPDAGPAHETILFPSRTESSWLRWRVLGFPFVNGAFTAALVGLQLISLWLLRASWRPRYPIAGPLRLVGQMAVRLPHAPGLVLWLLALLGGFAAFGWSGARGDRSKSVAAMIGGLHGITQCCAALALLWWGLRLWEGASGFAPALIVGGALGIGYLALGLMFALYLAITHVIFGMHNLEVYSAQAIERWKCFLRIRIDRDGATVHPIGLRRSSKRWVPAPFVRELLPKRGLLVTRRRFRVPSESQRIMDPARPLTPELIEPAFRCGRGTAPMP